MSSHQNNLDDLYLDRFGVSNPSRHPPQDLWSRLNQPSVILTGLVLAATLLYNLYGSYGAWEEALSSLGLHLWDSFVHVLPSAPLFAVDNWLNPQHPSEQMSSARADVHASKSAAMRRILRIDRGRGLMASVFQARSRALSFTGSALGMKPDLERPAGLGNRDNSCFQNSILQGLAAVESLPAYLALCLQGAEDTRGDDVDRAVTQTLQSLLADLNDSSNNGRTLWTPQKLKFLSTWTQQDAQEYYSKILDDIDKRAAKAAEAAKRRSGFESIDDGASSASTTGPRSEDSGYQSLQGSLQDMDLAGFRNPLEGLIAQRVACIQCGYSEGLSMIPFNCLTLSLGLRRQHDLYERLDAYSSLESIEGVECPKCTLLKAQRLLTKLTEQMREKGAAEEQLAEPLRRLEAVELALEEDCFDDETLTKKCKISGQGKVATTKTKQIVIARPPQSLAIHVNRSVFDPSTFDMVKNSAPIAFPFTLDLGPWCLGSADGTESPRGHGDVVDGSAVPNGERWLQDPTASMVAGDLRPSRLSGPIYELRAVVTHYGRHENGHYVCYRKFPRARGPLRKGTETDGTVTRREEEEEEEEGRDDVDDEPPAEDEVMNGGTTEPTRRPAHSSEMDWWRLSDHNVSKVDVETVASLGPAVFMLFYDCIDPSMVVQDSSETSRSAASQQPPPVTQVEEEADEAQARPDGGEPAPVPSQGGEEGQGARGDARDEGTEP